MGSEEPDQVAASSSRAEDTERDHGGAPTISKQPDNAASARSRASSPSDDELRRDQHKKENMGDMKVKL